MDVRNWFMRLLFGERKEAGETVRETKPIRERLQPVRPQVRT
jgi:hypothetical protein